VRRIGITHRVEVLEQFGERRDCLDQRWTPLLQGAGYLPVPIPNLLVDPAEYVAALDLRGIILTGGNDLAHIAPHRAVPERDRLERALLETCARSAIPVLGVCRGMQFMAGHHGAAVGPVTDHVGIRHRIQVDARSVPLGRGGRSVNSYHNFGLSADSLPTSLRPLAWAEDGSVEAFAHAELPQVGIMWHPEREDSGEPADIALLHFLFDR
jgi:N5-(cytidine 5'-diphosphoramidyl)-L-glutamine hydrolase